MARTTKGRMYKRENSKNWYLQYYVNGVQKRVSLDTGDEEKAKKKRDEILRPLQATTKAKRLKEVYHTLKDTEEEAENLTFEKQGAIELGKVWNLVSNHENFKEAGPRTLSDYKLQWTAFVEWIKKHYPKAKTLSDITTEIVGAYMETKKKRNKGTQNKIIRCCSRVFRLAYNSEDTRLNPFSGISTYSGRKINQEPHKPLSWDKAMEICDNAPDREMRLLFFLGLYTGQRLGDCVLLSWTEVDLIRNLIILTQRKTGQSLTIPIHTNLKPLFEEIPKSRRKGYVLSNLADIYINRHPSVITRKVKKVFETCGIPVIKEGTGPETDKRAVVQYSFHSLRHTLNTKLREIGVGDAVIQSITGHTSQAMTDRYTAIGGQVIQSAINQLPAISGEISTEYQERQEFKEEIDSLPIDLIREFKEIAMQKGF